MKYLKLYEFYKKRTIKDFIRESKYPVEYSAKFITCVNKNLDSLEGIEIFINMIELFCLDNKLTTLEGLENSKNLHKIDCHNNQLISLKGIEKLDDLDCLYCYNNKLTSLNGIENLLFLSYVNADNNPIEYPVKLPNKYLRERIYTIYDTDTLEKFESYEFQKEYLDKYPEKIFEFDDMGIIMHEKIKEKFADIIEGNEFGFFGLKN